MAVQPSGSVGGGGFSQNGTVDWGQVASRTVSYSVDVLSCLTAANVDSYTLEVGRIISSQFSISKAGTDNVTKALQKLRSHGSLGDVLWFGFGVRHIVRAMPATHEGLTCLALCAMVADFYPDDVSAEIFYELVKTFKVPLQGMPSMMHWKTLISACSGCLDSSSFGSLVDDMIKLSPFEWYNMLNVSDDVNEDMVVVGTGWSTPEPIAAALKAIGSVSQGQMKALTAVGCNDAGWLAAVCVWLFSLSIVVCDTDGNQLYSNCEGRDVQVKIVYEQKRASRSGSSE
jgi:hypothetical protein